MTTGQSDWRTRTAIACFATAAAAVAIGVAPAARPLVAPLQQDSCNLSAPGRLVAVGDVHGAFDHYTAILREAKLLDARLRWIGGNATLVQVGDTLDRGDDSRKVLDLVRRLEAEAPKTGGQVRFVLGNHEIMRMAGDWRYVSQADYASFQTPQADQMRERLYAEALKAADAAARAKGDKLDEKEFRKKFLNEKPLGAAEMVALFSESGEYGQWLRQHDIMARINGIAFVHAGPGRAFADRGCAGLNADARGEIKSLNLADPDLKKKLLWSPEGPLWYRGFVGVEPVATADDVTAVLRALGASHMVIGHTATKPGRIRSLYDGRILAIDSGMLGGDFFPEGVPSALEIDKGTFTAIYVGKREVLIKPDPAATRALSQPAARR